MGERIRAYRVLVGKPGGRRPLGDPGINVRIILRWMFRNWDGGIYWIGVAQGRGWWRALINAIMTLRIL
jgi:hypothetical protein